MYEFPVQLVFFSYDILKGGNNYLLQNWFVLPVKTIYIIPHGNKKFVKF